MKFKKIFLINLYILILGSAFGQTIANLNDSFYADAVRWEILGLVDPLPQIRPYPVQVVKNTLNQVIESDNEKEADVAQKHQERLFGKSISIGLYAIGTGEVESPNNNETSFDKVIDFLPSLICNTTLLDNIGVSFEAMAFLSSMSDPDGIVPNYKGPLFDGIGDDLAVSKLSVFQTYNSMASVGNEDVYFQAGFARNSFSNFYSDSIMLNPNAPNHGVLNFTINKPKWDYELTLLLLSATDSLGNNRYGQKFLYNHAIRFNPIPQFGFTYFETCVSGGSIDLTYLLPMMTSMAVQLFNGVADANLIFGMQMEYKPINSLRFNGIVYIDDANFNELVKFHLNTKMKLAGQIGVQYVPNLKFFDYVDFDYTLVAPYMYSHSMYQGASSLRVTEPNYQTYSTGGKCLGSQLEPNSDQFKVSMKFTPINNMKVDFFTSFTRHANVNESLDYDLIRSYYSCAESCPTDGSIYDYPESTAYGYFNYAQTHFMFLDQITKYYCVQSGLGLTYEIPTVNKQKLNLGFDYVFQFEKNKGVSENIYPGALASESVIVDDSEIENAYLNWKANLYNCFSNYFTLSIKYFF